MDDVNATRTTVATYANYRDAQRAVDHLSDSGFPVQRVAIVAEGLRLVEQVTGRLSWGRAALSGALSGALIGAFFGAVLGLLGLAPLASALVLVVYGLVVGAIAGALLGLISYAFTGGQRDFTSAGGLQADRYLVMVDPEFAPKAAELIRTMGSPAA